MSQTVWLWANTLHYPRGGGHRWVYINWALGLRACGLKIVWLEWVNENRPMEELRAFLESLKWHLHPYGLSESIALCPYGEKPLSRDLAATFINAEDATERDVLIDMAYADKNEVVQRFGRSALIDIDPGLTQVWINSGQKRLAPHDLYFTIGETVGRTDSVFADCGLDWNYIPPCVSVEWWPAIEAPADGPFTTVTHWWGSWMSAGSIAYENSKRAGFLPYIHLPRLTGAHLELALALCGESDEKERDMLRENGWHVQNAWEVAPTPWDFQRYIQGSKGEFSCAKPSCSRLQNAWISDRTLCYLASGRPAVVEHTGNSLFLPDSEGLFRFKDPSGALMALRELESNYDHHSRAARALAEEFFDAKEAASKLLEHLL